MESLPANFDIHREVGSNIERRVDVDELQAPGIFNLSAESSAL